MLLRVKDDWDIKDVYYIIRIQSNASEDSQSLSVWTKTEIWKKSAVAVEMNAVIIIFNQSCHTCSSLIAYNQCHIDKSILSLIFRHKPMWWMQEEGRRKGNGRVYLPLSQPGKDWLKIFNEYLKYCNMVTIKSDD